MKKERILQSSHLVDRDDPGRLELICSVTGPLLDWFHQNSRELPWRGEKDPYRIWVSEIMLQQTRIGAVMAYYLRFMEALPSLTDLARVQEERLLKLWQGLGYYSRAKNLKKAAEKIMDEYGGAFPDRYDLLLKLPGVGAYTAGAIASIAFGERVPAVDGNVLRVLSRLFADDRDISRQDIREEFRRLLMEAMPKEAPGNFNEALMELGELVCIPNGMPLCGECPLKGFCMAFRRGNPEELPFRVKKKARKIQHRLVWLIHRDGRVAIRKRPDKGLLSGLWELPNTEIRIPEDMEASCSVSADSQYSNTEIRIPEDMENSCAFAASDRYFNTEILSREASCAFAGSGRYLNTEILNAEDLEDGEMKGKKTLMRQKGKNAGKVGQDGRAPWGSDCDSSEFRARDREKDFIGFIQKGWDELGIKIPDKQADAREEQILGGSFLGAKEEKHIFSHIEWHMRLVRLELPGDSEIPSGWIWADRAALRDKYALPNAFRLFEKELERVLN
ncbi:MAG: A/G-specific adenine glycosylase [Lachnospiraceae bacterium]|nr:A/G-specific adenine glycosylase [Lachnospiraceae bacterium]